MSISAIQGAMRKRPTFDELVGIIKKDSVKLKLPDRTALRVEQWFDEPMQELEAHQRRAMGVQEYENEVRRMAMDLGVNHQDLRRSLIHISEPTRLRRSSYAVLCLIKKSRTTILMLYACLLSYFSMLHLCI